MTRTMRARCGVVGSLVLLGVIAGCPALQLPTVIPLGGSLNSFDVVAGEPISEQGTASLGDAGVTLGSGSIALDPSVITVTPAAGGKFLTQLQGNSTLSITVWVGSIDEADTVCDTGDEYGAFDVTLDENNVPVSVDPSNVTLTQDTLDALNSGQFSICLEIVSPVTGTVTIESLTFNLGL